MDRYVRGKQNCVVEHVKWRHRDLALTNMRREKKQGKWFKSVKKGTFFCLIRFVAEV